MSLIIDFYRDEASCDKSLPIPHPNGYTHFNIVRNWSDEKWESTHDFIQWIFPLKESSSFNSDSPTLTDDDIKEFKSDNELKQALFLSFHRFLRFLGLRCRYQSSSNKWETAPIVANEIGFDDEFFTKAEVEEKQKVWSQPNHNWLRITRCLHSLRLLGFEYAADSFFEALCSLYDSNRGITPNTFEYWQSAAQGGLDESIA